MDLFHSCTCSENGTWESGVRPRGRGSFACLNCNGSVETPLATGVRIVSKTDSPKICSCGVPWLSEVNSNCERCGLLISEERQERLRKVKSFFPAKEPIDEQEISEGSTPDGQENSDWVALVWVALIGLAGFGFFYNIWQEPASEYFIIQLINVAALGYTNFLAYPLLLFALIGSLKRFELVSRDSRSKTLLVFFLSPFAYVAFQLVFRILERLW